MNITSEERKVLRELAKLVAKAASKSEQSKHANLWLKCNKLNPERAMVFADPQGGWKELVPESELKCKNAFLRSVEMRLRRTIFRDKYIHDDFPITDSFDINYVIDKSNYGFENKIIESKKEDGAYHIEPVIKSYKDIEQLQPVKLSVDRETTKENYEIINDIFGDILNVRIRGVSFYRCKLTRILIHLRGLDQVMFDMYDNPDLFHELMIFLSEQQKKELDFYKNENLLSLNNGPDDIAGSGGIMYTDELSSDNFSGEVSLKDMTAWGESQEFGVVGPEQFEEFVLQYQLPILNQFGLVDYGCCEPLDQKFDLLIDNIPNLRWVAVSPWCDREIAADKLQNDYVYVYKPNPSYICSRKTDFVSAEQEIRETLEIAQNCAVHIVMKDTHTFCREPERITKWTDMAIKVVKEMCN